MGFVFLKKKMPEDFFEKLLNFGIEWKVGRIYFNRNNEVDISSFFMQ
jgi:hypothetical protein